MTKRAYRVTLTQVSNKRTRSIHYVEAESHNEAGQAALHSRFQSDMIEGQFHQWAPVVIKPIRVNQ